MGVMMSAPQKETQYDFVDELPGEPYVLRRRSPHHKLKRNAFVEDYAEALRQRPMTWAKWPTPLSPASAQTTRSRVRDGFYRALRPGGGFEVVIRDDILYTRHNPDRVTDDRTAAFQEGYESGYYRGLEAATLVIERGFQNARAELRRVKGVEKVLMPPAMARSGIKLTEAAVRKARKDFDSGVTLQQLADEHGVTIGSIHQAITGKTWGHVDPSDLPYFGQERVREGAADDVPDGGTSAPSPGPDPAAP